MNKNGFITLISVLILTSVITVYIVLSTFIAFTIQKTVAIIVSRAESYESAQSCSAIAELRLAANSQLNVPLTFDLENGPCSIEGMDILTDTHPVEYIIKTFASVQGTKIYLKTILQNGISVEQNTY